MKNKLISFIEWVLDWKNYYKIIFMELLLTLIIILIIIAYNMTKLPKDNSINTVIQYMSLNLYGVKYVIIIASILIIIGYIYCLHYCLEKIKKENIDMKNYLEKLIKSFETDNINNFKINNVTIEEILSKINNNTKKMDKKISYLIKLTGNRSVNKINGYILPNDEDLEDD